MTSDPLILALRPRHWEDVIGLGNEIAVLRRQLTISVPPGFLFKGPFGCGKTSLMYLAARELQGPDFPPDLEPYEEHNAARVTGINDVRDIVERAKALPMFGRYNIIIFDEAHKLSKPSQELLLKELEAEHSKAVYMIGSTEPQKLAEGLRAGRLFPVTVRGLDAIERRALIDKAVDYLQHKGDVMPFVEAIHKARVTSPRKILMAFQGYHAGLPPVEAVEAMQLTVAPEYHQIAMGTVFGNWGTPYTLFNNQYKSVAEQIKALDNSLKGTDEDSLVEDVPARPEAARAVRSIVAAVLKGQVYKGNAQAAEAMFILAHCISPVPGDSSMDFALTVGGLFRVNKKIKNA